jgi:hypothetical protein
LSGHAGAFIYERYQQTLPRRILIRWREERERDFVARVAAILAARFSKAEVLYDKFHEARFARRDLGFYLPDLYHNQSDLVVVVLSQDYQQKEWCGLEWHAIFGLLKKRKDSEVMLCRFDYVMVPGLCDTAGFVELDEKTPNQTATLILERLALNEGKPNDYYTKPSSAMRIFFAASTEKQELMEEIASWLKDLGAEVVLWSDATAFPPGQFTLTRLVEIARHEVSAAVLVFGADDKVWYRESERLQPRDNVLLELARLSLLEAKIGYFSQGIDRRGA